MAVCKSLQHIFEKPLPESPTLLESLSSPWKGIKNMKPMENSSFAQMFEELHLEGNNQVESSSPSSSLSDSSPTSTSSSSLSRPLFAELKQLGRIERLDNNIGQSTNNNNERSERPTSGYYPPGQKKHYKHSDSFSSMNSESLSLCTEGLGFESCDDVEDLGNEASSDSQQPEEKLCFARQSQHESIWKDSKRSRTNTAGSFPPPISCIGRTGKPWVCFQSFRQDGRFILQEIRFPTQEFLHACREDGRLRLQYIQSDDEILEGDEEDEEKDDASEDNEIINEEKTVDHLDDYHRHHQEHNSDAQDDADEAV